MIKLLKILLVFIFLGACNGKTNSDYSDILNVLESQRQAWNKGDIEGYMQGYAKSDSLVFVGWPGIRLDDYI